MDHRWSQQWRKDYDTQARQLWLDMEQRVWRDARIFSGMELSPPEPDASDDIDVLTDEEMDDIGQLGDEDPPLPLPLPMPLPMVIARHFNQAQMWIDQRRTHNWNETQ